MCLLPSLEWSSTVSSLGIVQWDFTRRDHPGNPGRVSGSGPVSFNMDKTHPLSSLKVVRSLDVKNDPFRHCEKGEELLGPEVPYLSVIGALMYLANCTRPDISFSVNLLARYSFAPTRRHWKCIKHILRYLSGTTNMSLFYSNKSKEKLLGYADARYLLDPHTTRSQTGYVFYYNGTTISWRSVRQTMVAT